MPLLHIDDHAQIFADEDGDDVPLRGVDLEAQSCEQGEGVVLQLEGLVEGCVEQGEVVGEG